MNLVLRGRTKNECILFVYTLKKNLNLSMKGIFCTKLDSVQSAVHSSCQRWLDSQPADVNGEILQV